MAEFELKRWVDKITEVLTPDHEIFEIISTDCRDLLITLLAQNPALETLAKVTKPFGLDELVEKQIELFRKREIAKVSTKLMNALELRKVKNKFPDPDSLSEKAKTLFGWHPRIFSNFEEVEKRKNEWVTVIRRLKDQQPDVFWRWVLGAWDEETTDVTILPETDIAVKDLKGMDTILEKVSRHHIKADKVARAKNISWLNSNTIFSEAMNKAKSKDAKLWDKLEQIKIIDSFPASEIKLSAFDIVIFAAVEARSQLEMLDSFLADKEFPYVVSGYRSRSTQKCIFTEHKEDNKCVGNLRNLKEMKEQAKRMKSSSAPGTSRHHWGGEFDLWDRNLDAGPAGNKNFRPQGTYHSRYSKLVNFARFLGFTQTYTDGLFLGFPPTEQERDSRVFRGQPNWKRLSTDSSGVFQPVDVESTIHAIIMATSSAEGAAMGGAAINEDMLKEKDLFIRRGGYLEECWHWSYYPVGQAICEVIRENLTDMNSFLDNYWKKIEKENGDKTNFDYPRKMWSDYVFNVHDIEADFEWRLGGGAYSRNVTPEEIKEKFYTLATEAQYKNVS